jgi:hypothetical protein
MSAFVWDRAMSTVYSCLCCLRSDVARNRGRRPTFIICILFCVTVYGTLAVHRMNIPNIYKSHVTVYIGFIQWLLHVSVRIRDHLQAVSLTIGWSLGDEWCKEPSIISGTNAAIWSKTNFWPTGHHQPQSNPHPPVCTIPSASGIFNCFLEVVFCEGVQYRMRFCLNHLTCVKMANFQLFLIEETDKCRVGGEQQSYF